LSWVEIELKDDLSFVPRFDTTAMIASKIPGGDQPVFDRCCGRFVFLKDLSLPARQGLGVPTRP
jgi:hypothetical protein